MIVLDTNVVSALMQAEPDPAVVDWLDGFPPEAVWTTAVTVFEIRFGLRILPIGRRRTALQTAFERALVEDFEERILPFDTLAAEAAAVLAAHRRAEGTAVDIRDTQIAGIVTARQASFATRNVRHFADLSVDVADPWNRDS